MATITTVIEQFIKNSLRVIKSKTWGSNTETADYVSSGPIDFVPPNNSKALFIKTGNSSQPVCVGYILKSAIQDLQSGEAAFFSVSDTPAIIKARSDGNLELNGNEDNIVRYSKLEDAYNELNDKFNSLVTKFNAHVHPGVTSGGSSTAPTTTLGSQSTGNIAPAKVDNVKTN